MRPEATSVFGLKLSPFLSQARMGTPSRVIDMADAIFANDYGAEASRVGLKEIAVEQVCFKASCTSSLRPHMLVEASRVGLKEIAVEQVCFKASCTSSMRSVSAYIRIFFYKHTQTHTHTYICIYIYIYIYIYI
jgi:hypothetical protein